MSARRPTLGLVLSGGGARGIAHIGVLRVFEREKIPIDYIAGTSMGGVIAAGFASGMNTYDLEREAFFATRKWRMLRLADPCIHYGGVNRGERLLSFFKQHFGEKTFADLHIPFGLVATNLNNGKQVVLRDGSVALALRATTSVPGLFLPVEVNGQRLVDGGVLNNLPVDVAREMGAEVVIAINISLTNKVGTGRWISQHRWMPSGIAESIEVVSDSIFTLRATNQEYQLQRFPPDLLICPEISKNINTIAGYGMVNELVLTGEEAAEIHLAAIKDLICPHWFFSATHRKNPAIARKDPLTQVPGMDTK